MGVNTNRLLRGSNGNVWFNGKLLANVKKIEAKVKGDFEDINVCGDSSTKKVYNGWSGEGTLALLKVDSEVWKLVADAYKSGVMPEINITSALTDVATKQAERVSISEITITEFALIGYEAKKLLEEEFPFSFSNYEPLDTISA